MKRLRICPKCGGKEVYRVEGLQLCLAEPEVSDSPPPNDDQTTETSLPLPLAQLRVYVCGQCRFVELYTVARPVEDGFHVMRERPPESSVGASFGGGFEDTVSSVTPFKEIEDVTSITRIEQGSAHEQGETETKVKVILLQAEGPIEKLIVALSKIPRARVPLSAEAFLEALPFVVFDELELDEATRVKWQLEQAGGVVDLQDPDDW